MDSSRLIEELERGERTGKPVRADGLRFTSLDRVLWRRRRLTKGDLAVYYARIADVMLRYVADRPLMVKRYPAGIEGEAVVQQRVMAHPPEGVRIEKAPTAEGESVPRYIGSRSTLLYLVQMSAVEFHPWHSRLAALDRPDWVIFDLDPSPGAGFRKVVRVAHALKAHLHGLGLPVGVKVSGSRGVHLHVPTGGTLTYDEAAAFARRVAERVAAEHPSLATVERSVNARGYRVYIDHLQNARGKTAVAPYSVRARPGSPVALPIPWDSVDDELDPQGFPMPEVPARLERTGDVWQDLFRHPGVERRQFL